MVSSSPGPARGRVPGTVRPVPPSQNAGARLAQVRGATYPPLTAPPSRGPIGSPAASSASGAAADQASAGGPSEANALSARSSGGNGGGSPAPTRESIEQSRLVKFEAMLSADVVDLRQLRTLSWSGVPAKCRATSWQLLLGYVPSNEEWRESTLSRKRREYCESVPTYFDVPDAERTEQQRRTLNQILLDVPRTSTSSPMFQNAVVRRSLERVLYIWSVRHPASGYAAAASRAAPATASASTPSTARRYVQGINDLVTPFFLVFLLAHLPHASSHADPNLAEQVEAIAPFVLAQVEADCFWCLSKLLDSIQDHYTFAQPGIQRMVFKLKELVARIDAKLHAHLNEQGVHFIQARPPRHVHAPWPSRLTPPPFGPVRVPLDELPADARAADRPHPPRVGHVPRRVRRLGGRGAAPPPRRTRAETT